MGKKAKDQDPVVASIARDCMANERTFLAWIRTSLGIMAFGLVIEKFKIFSYEIAAVLEKPYFSSLSSKPNPLEHYFPGFGIFLIALGMILSLLALYRYKKADEEIKQEKYTSPMAMNCIVTFGIVFIGLLSFVFLFFFH